MIRLLPLMVLLALGGQAADRAAIELHAAKRMAIDDPDLIPLWDSMSGTMWKRTE